MTKERFKINHRIGVFSVNRFSPNDSKFASCSDDSYIRIFDFMTGTEERELRGSCISAHSSSKYKFISRPWK